MLSRMIHRAAALMLLVTLGVSSLGAQTLAQQVPDDALLYIGWRGASQLGEPYRQSHFHELLAEPQTQAYLNQLRQTLTALGASEPGNDARSFEAVMKILPALWQHPTAVYGVMSPAPQLVLIVQPSQAVRDSVMQELAPLVAQGGSSISLSQRDDMIVLQMSPKGMTPPAYQKPAASLASTEKFKAAIASAHADLDAPMVAYVDVQTAIQTAIRMQGPAKEGQPDPQAVVAALGADKIRAVVNTLEFREKDWVINAHVQVPGPRTGLLAMIDDAKVTRDDLKKIPATANSFYAGSFDIARFLEEARAAAIDIQPQAAGQIDQMLFMGSMFAGINLQEDLFKALGPVWLMYSDPAMPNGLFGPGVGIVNKVRDAGRLKQSIEQLKVTALRQLQAMTRKESAPAFPLTFQNITYQGVEVQSVYIMMFALHWALADEHLFISTSPQGVASMVRAVRDTGEGITRRDDVKKMLSRLETDEVHFIQFIDLPSLAPQGYPLLMMVNQAMTMGASAELASVPPLQLPTLEVLLRHLSPEGYQISSSDQGLNFHYITPYAGAVLLGTRVDASSAAMGVGIMLPALGAARRTARQMQSSTQARGIFAACVLYDQQNPNTTPTLTALLEGNYFTLEYLLSPSGPYQVPPDFEQWDQQQRTRWVQENASYVLVTKDMKANIQKADQTKIVVFERPDHSGADTVSVAWADGHATREPIARVDQLLLEQTGQTISQLVQARQNAKP